ncbi:MAG TPA: hypothetical protein VH539_19650 [Gemmatimonadaceae bacterium]|jgi:hypothetical protein
MRVLTTLRLAVAIVATSAGCAGARTSSAPGVDRNLLVPDQFADKGYTNPYDVIAALRANWLESRGPNSFQSPTKVQVYLDGVRVGGVEALRTIDLRPVTYIRFFDGVAATARWGLDHGAGAIYVSTHPLSDMVGSSLEPGPAEFVNGWTQTPLQVNGRTQMNAEATRA